MRAALSTFVLLASLALATAARADVVDACPPGFDASHSGCDFDPEPGEMLACSICALMAAGLAAGGALLVAKKRRSRENG